MASRGLRALLVSLSFALALGATACVETATYEKAESQLDAARRAAAQKDDQIRALQWQLAVLGQQFREGQQRNEAFQRDLYAQVQQLAAANGGLSDRLKKAESERAALLLAGPGDAAPATGRGDAKAGPRADDLRRMVTAFELRNAQILDELARIERLLANRAGGHAGDAPKNPTSMGDVVDPWGFGSRK